MADFLTWSIILGTPALVVFAIVHRKRADRKRTAELERWAEERGFAFAATGKGLFSEPFARLPLFDRGFPRRGANILRGTVAGAPAVVFDYVFMLGVGSRGGRMVRQTVVAMQVMGVALPDFELMPKGVLRKLGESRRAEDAPAPELARRYDLRARSADQVRPLLVPTLTEALVSDPRWCLEAGRDWVLAYRSNEAVPSTELDDFVAAAAALLDPLRRVEDARRATPRGA